MLSTPLEAEAIDVPPTGAGAAVLVLDFSGRELYAPHRVAEAFHHAGEVVVYHSSPPFHRYVRYALRDVFARRRSLRSYLLGVLLHFTGRTGAQTDPGIRQDLRMPPHLPVSHVRPTLWQFALHLIATAIQPSSWRAVGDIRDGRFPSLRFAGVPVGGYLVDSFIHFRRRDLFYFGPRAVALVYGVIWLAEYRAVAFHVRRLALRHRFAAMLINHAVYAESGMVAHMVQAALGSDVNILHSMVSPDRLVPMPAMPECPFAAHTRYHLRGDAETHALPRPMWQASAEPTGPVAGPAPQRLVLAMHCLLDANDLHDDGVTPYPSYLDWARDSVRLARAHPDVPVIIRLHPDRRLFGAAEETMYRRLFSDLPPNCQVLPPEDPAGSPRRPGTVVVTFRGSIALELACLGQKPVVLGMPNCPDECCFRIRTREEYVRFLIGGYRTYDDTLTDAQTALARDYRRAMYAALGY